MTDSVEIRAVGEDDLNDFAMFVGQRARRAPADIALRYRYPWLEHKPNYGFMLIANGAIRGAIGAVYAEREIRGSKYRFCSLADWYVDEEYRGDSMSLLLSVLGQRGYTFTSFTHIRPVARILESMRFKPVSEHVWIIFPLRDRRGSGSITEIDRSRAAEMPERERRIFDDLHGARDCNHLFIRGPSGSSYCLVTTIRRRGVLFAMVLYASDPAVVQGHLRSLRKWCQQALGTHLIIAWASVLMRPAMLAVRVRDPRRPLFRSRDLSAEDIDTLYSELTL